uniref:Phosphatidylinositol-3,4,5-trisphosphate-dependent Rac exchange factor 1 n=1 Tax=Ciona savignyi TaxID=51511 RepID=H2Y5P4_CIOSA
FMERLQSREDDENDKLIPQGSVLLLLSNVEDLYKFHVDMLATIQECLQPEVSYEKQIGKAFLKYKDRFEVYAPYCSNHERAQKKLNELTENPETKYETSSGCLLLGNYVNDVSMEGFLLTPIQRICKYPLLLRELYKKTPTDHPDYANVEEALNLMKEVCSNVNETKRQLEQLEKLEDLQATIANWEGANLTDTCTRSIKQGSLIKISAGNIQERQFFLFDHLLVYAKKINALPRSKKVKRKKAAADQKEWMFKGRISTELMEIENLDDGTSDFHCGGYTVTNGWKVLNAAKNKWFVLLAKDKDEKEAWLNEFVMEREKRKMSMDQRDTIDVIHGRGRRIYYKLTHQGLIKDRKSKMRTHPKSLLGNELVQWLVDNKESKSIDEAIMLGQALLDCGIIHHVQDRHHFRNEGILFRFRYDDGTFKPRGESQDLVAKGLRIYCRVHCLFQPLVRDKDRNFRSYKQVIEAKLIDWLIDQGDCQSREEASNLGQSLSLDRLDFSDDSTLFKFFPDDDLTETNKLRDLVKKSSTKHEFKFLESYKTKTLLLMNVSDAQPLGFEAKYIEPQCAVVITAIIRGSQAQVQGFQPGQVILIINNDLMTSVASQEQFDDIMKRNLDKHKLIFVTVKAEDDVTVGIPVTKEGMGFQIRGSNPCVVHAVNKGGMAMNCGLVKGHAIMKVNGRNVMQEPHDDVAMTIREGCKLPPSSDDDSDKVSSESDDGKSQGSSSSLNVPSGGGIKKSRSFKRQNLAMLIGINHHDNNMIVQLMVANRHLERLCTFGFDNVNGVRNYVLEKMSESPSIFDLSSQLLEVLIAEDERVLSDVQALEGLSSTIVTQVFKRRRTLRYEVIQERLENYKKYKRHLSSYMWPSYKESRDRPSSLTAKDFCPTNCHLNIMQVVLAVSHTSEKYKIRGLNGSDQRPDNKENNFENMVHTMHSITCMAAPSFRTRGKEGHGLLAVLRGVEGNTELMDSIRQLMVGLDHALVELKQGQNQIIETPTNFKDDLGDSLLDSDVIQGCVPEQPPNSSIKVDNAATRGSGGARIPAEEVSQTGNDSECDSGRDRVSLISGTASTCSSEGVESINFIDLALSSDAVDKLQGTMEHFLSKIHSLNELVRSKTVQTVFENTQETTPNKKYNKIIEALTARNMMALSVCEGTDQFADVINTLIEAVDRHVNEVRTQLVLAVLLNEDPKLVSRRDKVFSQALVAAVSSFAAQLRFAIAGNFNNMKAYGVRSEEASKKWLEQSLAIGAAVVFQSMLNPNMPDENAMLEDSCIGINDLERVSFHFCAITDQLISSDFIDFFHLLNHGNRCALKVYFHLDKHVFIKLPPRLQAGGGVKLIPMLFNHGLEDLGNQLYEQGVTMQEFNNSINEKALAKLYNYYKRFRAFHLDRSKLPRDTEARAVLLSRPLNALDEIMGLLESNVKPRHGKPHLATSGAGVLTLAAEFCNRLGGCHVIMCNNGVHRSTVACSLEQSLILARCHGLPPRQLSSAALQLGHLGARTYCLKKNQEARDKTVKSAPKF